jgi:hypothetical protein
MKRSVGAFRSDPLGRERMNRELVYGSIPDVAQGKNGAVADLRRLGSQRQWRQQREEA